MCLVARHISLLDGHFLWRYKHMHLEMYENGTTYPNLASHFFFSFWSFIHSGREHWSDLHMGVIVQNSMKGLAIYIHPKMWTKWFMYVVYFNAQPCRESVGHPVWVKVARQSLGKGLCSYYLWAASIPQWDLLFWTACRYNPNGLFPINQSSYIAMTQLVLTTDAIW